MITLEPTKDNDVLASRPDQNFNRQGITVESCSYSGIPDPTKMCGARTFVQFDLSQIPSGSVITNAILKFGVRDSSDYGIYPREDFPRTYVVSRVIEDWEELGITWNNQPTITSENEISQPVNATPETFDVFDVIVLVQDALKIGNLAGLRVIDSYEYAYPGAIWVIWGSKEGVLTGYAKYPPQLEVTYEPPPKGTLEVHAYTGNLEK